VIELHPLHPAAAAVWVSPVVNNRVDAHPVADLNRGGHSGMHLRVVGEDAREDLAECRFASVDNAASALTVTASSAK
jgi:hypothetical protein